MTSSQIEQHITEQLHATTARMLEIERINMEYNKATNFGNSPNGEESKIASLLTEWDHLKIRRQRLKDL